MGSSSSKFKKYLHHGDEFAAMQVYQCSPELQRNLNPNISYGEHHNYNTALHYAAKHGMKHLLRTFLNDLGGNPNKKNGSNQTSLHAACQLGPNKSLSRMERRAACVTLILQWRGATLAGGGREKIDLAAQDQAGNTALHLAAAFGLEHCVQALIAAGSPLFVENREKQTPCDLAVKNGHEIIAQLLESKMVFDDSVEDTHNEDEVIGEEVYCGLRTQDLQEAKDQLLVETSDMLQVPLFTAEALLRDNEWSRELLLDKWMKDAVSCCELAGVEPPASALLQHSDISLAPQEDLLLEPDSPVRILERNLSVESSKDNEEEVQCGICLMSVKTWEQPNIKIACNHNFCVQCWESYLSSKILEGMHHDILCPAYDCSILVPLDVIERLVSPDLTRRYLHFDIKAFVESNKCIKWCPVAGCGRAVKFPEAEHQTNEEVDRKLLMLPPVTSHAVDCGNGHFFCWECLGEAHAPSGCAQWRLWQDKVNQVRPEELQSNLKDLEVASNCLWLVSNSKPCPNCKSPIQKNEGCNHIKCSKCKFDFCWVCLETWKKHSSATGGYFRCNRYPAAMKADEKQGELYTEAVARNQQIQDLNRFIHYYTRYKNHENSRKLEEPLLTAVKHKMEILASSYAGKEPKDKEKCIKFIEDTIWELLKARRVLCGSYVYGFYLEDTGYSRSIFEFMQNELELVTKKLSEMIARPYLKTPRHTIITTTALVRRKRHEFVRAVAKGLVPPETPPGYRRRRKRICIFDLNHESDMSHAIAASLKSFDPNQSWVKDAEGRHNNLTAIYEWPGLEKYSTGHYGGLKRLHDGNEEKQNSQKSPCRMRNPHEYCSIWCACAASSSNAVPHDDAMDLAIALEMSRLQMIEDSVKRGEQKETKPKTSVSITQTDSEVELSKAIELSLKSDPKTAEIGVTTEELPPLSYYKKTHEDVAIDYFLKSFAGQSEVNLFHSDRTADKLLAPKEVFKTQKTEDGVFKVGDFQDIDDGMLRRARSTGDLNHKNDQKEPRFETDVEKTESGRIYSASDKEVCHILSPEPKGNSVKNLIEDVQNTLKAIEQKTEFYRHCPERASTGKIKNQTELQTNLQTTKTTRSATTLENPYDYEKKFPNLRKQINESHKRAFRAAGGKIPKKESNLRIRIAKSPDSSEYETETGIPRSPTLFISGVSISRTPEPCSPALKKSPEHRKPPENGKVHQEDENFLTYGRQSRSSSLTVPKNEEISDNKALNSSCCAILNCNETKTNFISLRKHEKCLRTKSDTAGSKSTTEHVFRFPKSSTESSLSSVLHIQENNLSSDDFHEVLFLLDKSPRSSKKRKKSKERDKLKEASSAL